MKNSKKIVFVVVALLSLQSFAQNNQNSSFIVPLNENNAQLIAYEKNDIKNNTKDYSKKSKATNVQFSPDEKFLSFSQKDENGDKDVYVKDISTGKITKTIEGKEGAIKQYGWLNNETLIYTSDLVTNNHNRLFLVSLGGSNTKDLTAIKRAEITILSLLKEDKDHMIIHMPKKNSKTVEAYKLSIKTGALEPIVIDALNNKDLTHKKRAKVSILSLLKEDKDHIIIQMEKKYSKTFEPFKLNIATGSLAPLFKQQDL